MARKNTETGTKQEKMMKVYEVMDSFEMFDSKELLEVRWRGPFEGYR
jgi:hypothetical protein